MGVGVGGQSFEMAVIQATHDSTRAITLQIVNKFRSFPTNFNYGTKQFEFKFARPSSLMPALPPLCTFNDS